MADALISVLLEQLASVVFEHTKQAATLILNAEEDVQCFSSNLKAIQAVLEDAEKKQVTEARVRDWLQKLKDVSYEMDDVLDEWNIEIHRQQVEEGENAFVTKKVCFPTRANCFCFGQVNKAIHYHSIASRIKDLNERLTLIAVEKEKYDFQQSAKRGTDEQLVVRQKTSSLLDISTIFGRDEEKEMLLSKLLGEHGESSLEGERFLVIPIIGMGGMGKTTLAQLAYNDENVTAQFDKKVWVCVSDPFDEIKIAKAIIETLDETQSSSNELETLLQCIKTRVKNKKFLLILDDVWTQEKTKWDNLKLPVIMQSCKEGSAILVTTRKEEVAKMMRATKNMIRLDKLSDENCLALFNSIAFLDREEDEANGFGTIGKEIVRKCKGLPLIVKTLGSLVWCKKTRDEWRDILNSKIWELEEVEDQVFRPLLLSYYDLTPAVRRCLVYCAIFPKDYYLRKDELIDLWMSQNYLNSKKNKEKRKLGESYFETLSMRCFFQDFWKDGRQKIIMCQMHDILHDFVQFLTKKEFIIIKAVEVEGDFQKMELEADRVRHLTLTDVAESTLATSCYGCKNMRTLTILDSKLTTISPGAILQMKCLRTLKLIDSKLNEVPKEIGDLIHLRYINLSRSMALKEMPEAVCDLYNMQTLNLRQCWELEKLPKAMGKLINLKHLYIRGCKKLRYVPKGIGSLKSLQALDCFYVCEDDDEALKLEDLGIMDLLQDSFSIERLGSNVKDDSSEIRKAQLGNKEHLSELSLWFQKGLEEQRKYDSEILNALQPHQNLESLYIEYCHGTIESLCWIKSLGNLRQLYLGHWNFWEVLPPLGKLPSLEVLDISGMAKVKKVGDEFLGRGEEEEKVSAGILFPKLKVLTFWAMHEWEEWEGNTKDSSEITIMPRLSEFRIKMCRKLKALPDFLYKIATLRTLEIEACRILEVEYEKGAGKEWHNISHIPNLSIQSGGPFPQYMV